MLYLLDANTLIDANRDYYRIGSVDEYWSWLIYQGEQDRVKIPLEIYEEIKDGRKGKDALADWAKAAQTEAALRLNEEVDIDLVRKVTNEGYAPDLNDIEIEEIGRDPFLIAYANGGSGRTNRRNDGTVKAQGATKESKNPGCLQSVRDRFLQRV